MPTKQEKMILFRLRNTSSVRVLLVRGYVRSPFHLIIRVFVPGGSTPEMGELAFT